MRLIAYWLQRGLINCCWNSLFAFTFASSLFAQSFKLPPPEVITDRQGLPQAFVSAIVQDQKGFVWLATLDGLCRYDGNRFKVFQPTPNSRPSISSSSVLNLKINQQGQLLIASEHDLDLFNPVRETFINVAELPIYKPYADEGIADLYPDHKGRIWVSFSSKGMICLDLHTHRVRQYRHESTNSASLSHNAVRAVLNDQRGAIWVATEAGLDRLDERTGQFTHFSQMVAPIMGVNGIIGLHERPNGELLILSNEYLLRLIPATGKQVVYRLPRSGQLPGRTRFISDRRGNDYFTQYGWLFRFNPDQGVQVLDRSNQFKVPQIEQKQDRHNGNPGYGGLWIDNSDVLWVGTNGLGVHKYNLLAAPFWKMPYQVSFHADVLKYELALADNQRPAFSKNTSPYYFRSTLDGAGKLWFNVGETPFYRVDLQTKQLTTVAFPISFKHTDPLAPAPLTTDPAGRIWAVVDSLAFWYDSLRSQWERFPHPLWRSPPGKNSLKPIFLEAVVDNQSLWLASKSQGLYQVDRLTGRIRQFTHRPQDPTSLSSNNIYCLFADPIDPDILWIGTQGSGLCRFNKRTGKCQRFTTQNGLPNNVIYAAIPDKEGSLWIATNKGVCRMNRQTFQTRTYTHEDGLLADEFNRFHFLHLPGLVRRVSAQRGPNVGPAAFQSDGPDDRIILGGVEGITSFYPAKLRDDQYQPPVEIIDIRVNNHSIQPALIDSLPVQNVNRLDLPHDQNFLTVGFAALQYNNPGKLQYRYQLEGIDQSWTRSERPEAIYTNLSPGNYTLKLNASNTSGIWSPRVRTLSVTIHSPLWATWWAYGLYAVILGAVAYGLFRTYVNRLHLRQQVSLKQQEAQQLKAVDEMKTRFFSNITHEFRTPLTLILTPAEQLKQHIHEPEQLPQNRRRLETIDRNAHQLIGLVNQLLDLSKLEANALPITEVQGNLVSFIGQLVASFEAQAEAKSIHLVFAPADGPSDYWFDADKLERIVTNLVANALKFTAEGGTVTVVLTTSGDRIQLSVTDTGIGIPVDKLAHIFDRFYQVDDSSTRQQEGTGIGLALVKELVDLQSGQIGVTSQPGEGSTFAVQLPYRRATASLSVTHSDGGQPSEDRPIQESRPNGQEKHRSDAPVVLLVEDNAELAHFIAGSLPTTYQLVKAANGAEGWQQAIDQMPDLVISDVLMPVMDGYTLCRKLKEDVRTSHIPVVLLTAKSAYESRLEGLSLGADDYIAKPFHVPELQLRVRNLLEQRRQYREWLKAQLASPDAPTNGPELQAPDPFLDRLNTLLESHLSDQTFGVDQLAQELAMSRMNLHRKLKAVVNLAPGEVIRMYRLKRATQFLRQGLRSAETAYQVGFDSPSYFSKSFRDEYGLSPSEYVEAEQKKANNG